MSSLPLPSPLRRRWFLFRTPGDEPLMVTVIFSCVLVLIRIAYTGRLTFLFMPWNLFLAFVPYFISSWLCRPGATLAPILKAAGVGAWILFVPNTFYILTDLYHLADGHRSARIPEWFDLALILSFALNGTLLGVRSTRQMEKLLAPGATIVGRWFMLLPVMWLNALGVYIGRYLRYNSWDVFTNPVGLAGDIFRMVIHPLRHDYAWGMIFCFTILLSLIYSLLTINQVAAAGSGIVNGGLPEAGSMSTPKRR